MHSHEAHIGEYRGTTEEHILNKIQFWVANSLHVLLKKFTYFLSSSLKTGMLRQTNISEALLYFGMPNSFRKLLLYAILKFFNAVFEQLYHNIEQYELEQ